MSVRAALERALVGAAAGRGAGARLLILTYHRVLAEPDPLIVGEADAGSFDAQMAVLAGVCTPLPLAEAARRLREGTLPPRAACVTFDDGYLNNVEVAAPILRRYGVPATLFIAQNAIEAGIMWNDLVIEAVRRAPSRFDLESLGLGVVDAGTPAARAALVPRLLDVLKYRPLHERWEAAAALFRAVSAEAVPRLMLTTEQVAKLADAGFDAGGHTVNHPILATLPPEDARQEIAGCADWLQRVTGVRPAIFAYPNGRPGRDFDATHVAQVRESGYAAAVTTAWGAATSRADAYELPRVTLWETSRPRLVLRLARAYAS